MPSGAAPLGLFVTGPPLNPAVARRAGLLFTGQKLQLVMTERAGEQPKAVLAVSAGKSTTVHPAEFNATAQTKSTG